MITSQQMRELEDFAESQGVTQEELLENAGRQVFEVVKEKYNLDHKHILIFAGQGRNGGDGFVAARYFAEYCPVVVLFFGSEQKLGEEAKKMYDKIRKHITIVKINEREDWEKFHLQKDLELILIDALMGIGFSGPLREPPSLAIDYFNSLSGIKIAVDVPSGLNPDTGEVTEKYCDVDLIITFHDLKTGLEKLKNKTRVVDIGIPLPKI